MLTILGLVSWWGFWEVQECFSKFSRVRKDGSYWHRWFKYLQPTTISSLPFGKKTCFPAASGDDRSLSLSFSIGATHMSHRHTSAQKAQTDCPPFLTIPSFYILAEQMKIQDIKSWIFSLVPQPCHPCLKVPHGFQTHPCMETTLPSV